tara:strand:- start:27 stop:521 length:495 start_codon:yes stop_codon:yes gene_type:complete
MAIRKNKKRIDPRYFLHETTYRDLDEELGQMGRLAQAIAPGSDIGAKIGLGQDSDDLQRVITLLDNIKGIYKGLQNGRWMELHPLTQQGELEAIKKGMDEVYLMHDRSQAGRADHGEILQYAIYQMIELYEDANLAPPGDKINVQYMKAGIEGVDRALEKAKRQ